MMIFIDTNVLIGYCFEVHSDNGQCKILDETPNLWFSDKVLNEWKKNERRIRREFESKILRHVQDIRKKTPDMIEINNRERLIRMADIKIQPFLQKWYQECVTYPVPKDELCDQIENDILLNMQFDIRARLSKLKSLCREHKRTNEYSIEESALEVCVHNGDGDRAIVLDAHDLAINPVLNKLGEELQFWTFDHGISMDCKDKILSNLKIADVKDVKYDFLSLR